MKTNKWSQEEILTFTHEYPNTSTQELAIKLGRSVNALQMAARVHGLKKDKEFIKITHSKNGRMKNSGQFPARHGMAHPGNRTYSTWFSMKCRCYKPTHKSYADYGGRGITVCQEWRDDFAAFLSHMGERPEGTTLGRIDNQRGYEPGNCRWETMAEQNNNRRSNRLITAFDKTQTLKQWADERIIKPDTLAKRIDVYGWSVADAISKPVKRQSNNAFV